MVLALDTEDRGLMVFPTDAEAIAYCEGVDVEAGTWRFFAQDGSPLEAHFTKPNQRGSFIVQSGTYTLMPSKPGLGSPLSAHLGEVTYVEGCGFSTVTDIEHHLRTQVQGDSR